MKGLTTRRVMLECKDNFVAGRQTIVFETCLIHKVLSNNDASDCIQKDVHSTRVSGPSPSCDMRNVGQLSPLPNSLHVPNRKYFRSHCQPKLNPG
jgi:hypothetical protein